MVEPRLDKAGVGGSIPPVPTIRVSRALFQWGEFHTRTPSGGPIGQVAASSFGYLFAEMRAAQKGRRCGALGNQIQFVARD